MVQARRVALTLGLGVVLAACGLVLGVADVTYGVADSGSGGDGGVVTGTSCDDASGPGLTGCGPDGGESCCATLLVPGGVYERSNEPGSVATVSGFRLDRFEVTVGRFRQFVNAVVAGWMPAAGSGKHTHLNGGQGLANVGDAGPAYEQGWDPAWNGSLSRTLSAWNANLSCNPATLTWTLTPGANEARPIVCVSWFEAVAFCIWDRGFLPSEAEWNYAAAAGAEQRQYPWSNPPSSTTIDCTFANYGGSSFPATACHDAGASAVGVLSPKGDGKWGHTDLAGNAKEWTLDTPAPYVSPCTDCAYLTPAPTREARGGSYGNSQGGTLTWYRADDAPLSNQDDHGLRCARAP
jgi:formylglycine-generating enzyme required for sulfatase activity